MNCEDAGMQIGAGGMWVSPEESWLVTPIGGQLHRDNNLELQLFMSRTADPIKKLWWIPGLFPLQCPFIPRIEEQGPFAMRLPGYATLNHRDRFAPLSSHPSIAPSHSQGPGLAELPPSMSATSCLQLRSDSTQSNPRTGVLHHRWSGVIYGLCG